VTEAWLLFDEHAIRRAAGNPNGRDPIPVPFDRVENAADPKSILHDVLRSASGLSGRRREKFDVRRAVHRVAEYIDDFSSLRRLSAFLRLESEVQSVIGPWR